LETILDATSRFTGEIAAKGDLRLEGVVEGPVRCEGRVVVAQGAHVHGDLWAAELEVWGTLEGNASASGLVVLAPGGRILGDVRALNLRVDDGGVLQGKVITAGEAKGG
jgi:cytoskeletal protein CcmA (bactofilin family)